MSPQNNVGRSEAGMGAAEMALRSFDDYEVTLGDEMRGERASLGVSLADVERDLRIKSGTILAIENADLSGFPNESVVAGYVRSYARYLGMDPEQSYKRFCDETGFRSPTARVAVSNGLTSRKVAINSRVGANLTESRFAPPAAPSRIGSSVSLGAVASGVAMVALVGGLSFGGYYLLQDIQKVGVAPLPDTPDVVVEAKAEPAPLASIETAAVERPDASAYDEGGILSLAAADIPPPSLPSRDGPISDLDPFSTGVFASVGKLDANDPRKAGPQPTATLATTEDWTGQMSQKGIVLASLSPSAMMTDTPTDAQRLTMSARATTDELAPKPKATVIHATGEAWVRVKDADGTVVFEGILAKGETFKLPERMKAPEIRAGNAGDVYVVIGDETFGPLGAPGRVVKKVSLDEDAVRATLPAAEGVTPAASAEEPVQRAELILQ